VFVGVVAQFSLAQSKRYYENRNQTGPSDHHGRDAYHPDINGMNDRPEAIVITLSQQTIKDRKGGYRQIIEEWESCTDTWFWYYKCGNAPKMPVTTIYWVIMGRIRWKCLLIDIDRDKWIQFSNRTAPMYAKAWLILTDFEPIPRRQQIIQKGFQGFRYSQKLFQ